MSQYLLISDAAKEVKVESHVLRYWEEELHLPIRRNELGHRYYTEDDVERFKQIKSMKERGLQLKAIKMILKDGQLNILPTQAQDAVRAQDTVQAQDTAQAQSDVTLTQCTTRTADVGATSDALSEERDAQESSGMAIEIIGSGGPLLQSREEKARRLQWLLQQLIRETLLENNKQLCSDIKENVMKELDYQFRMQEEREEARDKANTERSEEYYKKMDDLLRKKSKKKRHFIK